LACRVIFENDEIDTDAAVAVIRQTSIGIDSAEAYLDKATGIGENNSFLV
jgi:hypothetical protein